MPLPVGRRGDNEDVEHGGTRRGRKGGTIGDDYSVTFVTPHQRNSTGGVYSIQQFAAHLGSLVRVNLVVQRAEPTRLAGVTTYRSETLAADEVPDADAIVLGINADGSEGFFELPASKGERLLLFQGYKTLGSDVVDDRLRRGLRVMAISRWLVERARANGADAHYTPVGLDHEIFLPGQPNLERGPSIAMKLHPTYWKGTADGLEALARVKEERPEAEIRLFAVEPPTEPPPFEHRFLALDTQSEVAALFRDTAIFVCPSWEEGFGMPGLEALASGAALATTDTKGSRDYAIDGETALVSPPRDPASLARNILTLLERDETREALSTRGAAFAREHFGGWDDAARVMAHALPGCPP
jgi:glycosyltransferase involved in cell wall biosynthesis